ncbi:MAG: hypothetical protein AAF492_03960 [Verrucomicrobiota bacterium]
MKTSFGLFFTRPFRDAFAGLEKQLEGASGLRGLILSTLSLVISWWIYVPIHELLHAFGCWVTGGTVTELMIARKYGGDLLAKLFPFVVGGGDYAGRLTGFDTGGSDLVYLATDFMPFVLSVFPGVLLLRLCMDRRSPFLFGAALILGFAPLYNFSGDFFEMGSILVTRLAGADYYFVRSDDVFRLMGELADAGETRVVAYGLVAASFAVAVLLSFATYALGRWVADKILLRRADSV